MDILNPFKKKNGDGNVLLMKRKVFETYVGFEVTHEVTGVKRVFHEKFIEMIRSWGRNSFYRIAIHRCMEEKVLTFHYSNEHNLWFMEIEVEKLPSMCLKYNDPTFGGIEYGSLNSAVIKNKKLVEELNELKNANAPVGHYASVLVENFYQVMMIYASMVSDYDTAVIVKDGLRK